MKTLNIEQREFLEKVLASGLLNRLPHHKLPDFAQGLDITELIDRDYWFNTNVILYIHKVLQTGRYEKCRHLNVIGVMWKNRTKIFGCVS